ncbi:hypothetical protein HDU98_006536 [Podochytrium sp. JEL0797]|nr:hypothetical protein HDU98_006536 [Podochytrium sp. JEL0797]
MTLTWHTVLLDALQTILDNPLCPTAEKLLKQTFRANQNNLTNPERKALARKLYGTCSLRLRLQHLLTHALGPSLTSLSRRDQLICFVTLYTFHEEATYFSADQLEEPEHSSWITYATQQLGSNTVSQLQQVNPSAIPWPTNRSDFLSTFYSLPPWLSTLVITAFPSFPHQNEFCNAMNHPGAPAFRTNLFKTTREALLANLDSFGIPCKASDLSPSGVKVVGGGKPEIRNNPWNRDGSFEVQDEGSQLISVTTGVEGGMRVLDMCCGRGGKALHLADLMREGAGGVLVCHDVDENTIRQARVRLEKPGICAEGVSLRFVCSKDVELVNGGRGGDMSAFPVEMKESKIDVEAIRDALGEEGLADVVLVDAPCSSLGTLRRGPNVRWEMDPESLKVFPPLQRSILKTAVEFVKPGGVLVYATCTFNDAECGHAKAWFDHEFRDEFVPGPLGDVFGGELMKRLLPDSGDLERGRISSIQLSPSVHNTDAFYISRWIKKE